MILYYDNIKMIIIERERLFFYCHDPVKQKNKIGAWSDSSQSFSIVLCRNTPQYDILNIG